MGTRSDEHTSELQSLMSRSSPELYLSVLTLPTPCLPPVSSSPSRKGQAPPALNYSSPSARVCSAGRSDARASSLPWRPGAFNLATASPKRARILSASSGGRQSTQSRTIAASIAPMGTSCLQHAPHPARQEKIGRAHV